jgi:hypothetical protein
MEPTNHTLPKEAIEAYNLFIHGKSTGALSWIA